MSITVLVVDDDPGIAPRLREMLAPEADIVVVGEAAGGAEGAAVAERLRPDVVLMDLRMEPVDGIVATRRITAEGSAGAVLVLSVFGADRDVMAAIEAGAQGYILKDEQPELIVSAIRVTAAGGSVFAPAELQAAVRTHRGCHGLSGEEQRALERLSPREREVLPLLGAGLTNADIASELRVAEETVRSHVDHIKTKLGTNRIQTAILAIRAGLMSGA
jgi:DNA-binding NarL/FixJ family response regulator